MSFVKEEPNEHGTTTGHFVCDACKEPFTVTPNPRERGQWDFCLSDQCTSYDPHRDADVLFMTDDEIADEKSVVSISKLRERRNGV